MLFQHGKCRSVTEFEKQSRVGEGTYGIVCKCVFCSFLHHTQLILFITKCYKMKNKSYVLLVARQILLVMINNVY